MGEPMHDHDHQQCRSLFEKLSEYIDNELDEALCEKIEHHLKGCPPCQACLATLKQTVAMCKQMKSARVPKDFSERLHRMMAQYGQSS